MAGRRGHYAHNCDCCRSSDWHFEDIRWLLRASEEVGKRESSAVTGSNMEESIATLLQLGFERSQAINALARYNYDVERAANYLFSGHADEDEVKEPVCQPAIEAPSNNLEPSSTNATLDSNYRNEVLDTHSASDPTAYAGESDLRSTSSIHESETSNEDKRQFMIKEYKKAGTVSNTTDSTSWSVVPFTPTAEESKEQSIQTSTQYLNTSLTWWRDPEDPSERASVNNLPAGLRPPTYDHHHVPIFVQAIFHISLFRKKVLAFRPVPPNWGEIKDYWNERGSRIPQRMYKPAVMDKELPDIEQKELYKLNDLHPTIEQNIEDHQEQLLPESIQVIEELQKLFAFLGATKRRYGNVTPFIRALLPNHGARDYANDLSFDAFLDLFQKRLNTADEQNMQAAGGSLPTFKDLFCLQAKVGFSTNSNEGDIPDVEDVQDVYYLPLETSGAMRTFYDCLDPFMMKNYQHCSDSDEENDGVQSECSADDSLLKITTLQKSPAILIVTLENRTYPAPNDQYIVEETIFLDRYLEKNKDVYIRCQQRAKELRDKAYMAHMEASRRQASRNTTSSKKIDASEILTASMQYFESQAIPTSDQESLDSFRRVLNSIHEKIERRLEELQNIQTECYDAIKTLFDVSEMQENPYDLRATLHHDGKNGTGHYWAYILVEASETNLLQDMPCGGSWYRFCDAAVTPASFDDVLNETVPPFALLYAEKNIPTYSIDDLESSIPEDLMDYIKRDNVSFQEEMRSYESETQARKRLEDLNLYTYGDESSTFNGSKLTDPITNTADQSPSIRDDLQNSSWQQQAPEMRLRMHIATLEDIANQCEGDDYRLLEKFELFLFVANNTLALEHLLCHYTISAVTKNDLSETEGTDIMAPCIDEASARCDIDLTPVFHEYDAYLSIGRSVASALSSFSRKEYYPAIQHLLIAKRQEGQWKTRLALNATISNAYSGLESLSFDATVRKFGKTCLKVLNDAAYQKATNIAYRSRGLEEAIRIAHFAQTILGPEVASADNVFEDLRSKWFQFYEQDAQLDPLQAEQLNTLLMAYLEGQVGNTGFDEYESVLEEEFSEETWRAYKRARDNAEIVLREMS